MLEIDKIRIKIIRMQNRLLRKHSQSVVTVLLKRRVTNGQWPKEALKYIGANRSETLKSLRRRFNNDIRLKNFILNRDGYRCSVKGCKGRFLSIDHIRPLSCYPSLAFASTNLRVLCRSHNSKKGTRL